MVLRFNDVLLYLIVNLLYIAVGQAPDAAAYNSGQQPVQPGVQPAGVYGQPIVGQPGVLGIYHMGPGCSLDCSVLCQLKLTVKYVITTNREHLTSEDVSLSIQANVILEKKSLCICDIFLLNKCGGTHKTLTQMPGFL